MRVLAFIENKKEQEEILTIDDLQNAIVHCELEGVTPDVKVEVSDEQKLKLANKPTLVATKDDPCYAQAIALLKTSAASARPAAGNEALAPKK